MNLLTIIVLLILVLFAVRGYRQGLIKSIASVISLLASIVLVSFVTPYVSEFIETQTGMYEFVAKQCQETFSLEISDVGKTGKNETITDVQNALIDQLEIPDILKKSLKKHNTANTYQKLAINNFNEYVPKFMADVIIRAASFVIAWIIIFVFIRIVIMSMDAIANLPIIHGANQMLGLALGIFRGLIVVWIMFIMITILGGTNAGKSLLEMIAESPILRFMYDSNMLLRTIQSLASSLF